MLGVRCGDGGKNVPMIGYANATSSPRWRGRKLSALCFGPRTQSNVGFLNRPIKLLKVQGISKRRKGGLSTLFAFEFVCIRYFNCANWARKKSLVLHPGGQQVSLISPPSLGACPVSSQFSLPHSYHRSIQTSDPETKCHVDWNSYMLGAAQHGTISSSTSHRSRNPTKVYHASNSSLFLVLHPARHLLRSPIRVCPLFKSLPDIWEACI